MWLDKQLISFNAYHYCRWVRDNPKIRKHITTSSSANLYCNFIKDKPKVRKYITSQWNLKELKKIRNVKRPVRSK